MTKNTESKKDVEVKSAKINDGKCCRCVSRKNNMCSCKKSTVFGKYVARKGTCKCFKYKD